jgi:hypothetical protein
MGLILKFPGSPSPGGPHHADDSLTAGMHVDVLYRHLLLALAAMPVESLEEHGVRARQLVGLVQVPTSALRRLLRKHRAPIAFHRRVVRGEELRGHHRLKLIFRPDPDEGHHGRAALMVLFLFLRMSHPKTAGGLIDQDIIPVVGRGPTHESQPTLKVFWIKRQA